MNGSPSEIYNYLRIMFVPVLSRDSPYKPAKPFKVETRYFKQFRLAFARLDRRPEQQPSWVAAGKCEPLISWLLFPRPFQILHSVFWIHSFVSFPSLFILHCLVLGFALVLCQQLVIICPTIVTKTHSESRWTSRWTINRTFQWT